MAGFIRRVHYTALPRFIEALRKANVAIEVVPASNRLGAALFEDGCDWGSKADTSERVGLRVSCSGSEAHRILVASGALNCSGCHCCYRNGVKARPGKKLPRKTFSNRTEHIQDVVLRMRKLAKLGDTEAAHLDADDLLIEALEVLACEVAPGNVWMADEISNIINGFRNLKKWYA